MLVHRQIRRLINDPKAHDDDQAFIAVEKTAEQASTTERRAETATRDAVQWLKCEFMSHKIGDIFWGVVASVTDFGMFVELEEFYIDGLVHITSLGQDYYRFDSDKRQLVGESSKRVYHIGQRLEVQVSRVDMEQGRIDFSLKDVLNEKFDKNRKRKFNHKAKQGASRNKTHERKKKR